MKMDRSKKTKTAVQILNRFGPLLALLLVFVFFSLLNPRMATFTALETIIQQTVIVGVAAIGMTLVIISGGIDLSAGSVIAFGSVTAAMLMQAAGLSPVAAAVGGILSGAVWGFINGILITRFRLVPFIVTLGTLLIVRGFAKGLAGSMPIDVDSSWLSDILASLPPGRKWQLIPPGGWVMILAALGISLFLKSTPLGRHIFAVGSNQLAARLCGIRVSRVKIFVYTIGGAFAGAAGLMLMSYQSQGDPTGAAGLELDIIAAVVIGGGSLSGGEGSVPGSLIGAVIMTVIRTGCQLNGWPAWVTQIVTGGIIVAAVAVDRLRHRRMD